MKFTTIALAVPLLGFVHALPNPFTPRAAKPFTFNTQNFTFNAAAATFKFVLPLDGQSHPTNVSTLNVDHIRTPGYAALAFCTFYDSKGAPIYQPRVKQESDGVIVVGPPQGISAIQCAPSSSQCFPDYYTCEYSSPTTGTFVSNCCSGICAATKCRPRTGTLA